MVRLTHARWRHALLFPCGVLFSAKRRKKLESGHVARYLLDRLGCDRRMPGLRHSHIISERSSGYGMEGSPQRDMDYPQFLRLGRTPLPRRPVVPVQPVCISAHLCCMQNIQMEGSTYICSCSIARDSLGGDQLFDTLYTPGRHPVLPLRRRNAKHQTRRSGSGHSKIPLDTAAPCHSGMERLFLSWAILPLRSSLDMVDVSPVGRRRPCSAPACPIPFPARWKNNIVPCSYGPALMWIYGAHIPLYRVLKAALRAIAGHPVELNAAAALISFFILYYLYILFQKLFPLPMSILCLGARTKPFRATQHQA